jgi:hypothetical protein
MQAHEIADARLYDYRAAHIHQYDVYDTDNGNKRVTIGKYIAAAQVYDCDITVTVIPQNGFAVLTDYADGLTIFYARGGGIYHKVNHRLRDTDGMTPTMRRAAMQADDAD